VSTFALVVLGVGACIGVATALLLRPDEPATSSVPPVRAPARARTARPGGAPAPAAADEPAAVASGAAPAAASASAVAVAPPRPRRPARPDRPLEGEPNTPTPWHVRLRAVLELAAIAVVLGIALAAAIGLVVVGLFGLLRGAVG
jgi:hypothetical protein